MQKAKTENTPTGSLIVYRAPRYRGWVYGWLREIDTRGGATVQGLEDGRFSTVSANNWKTDN